MGKKGGAQPGAGRPSAYQEESAKKLSRAAMVTTFGSEEKFFEHIASKAKTSYQYLKLLAAYGFGQPSEKIEHSVDGNFTVVRKVVK